MFWNEILLCSFPKLTFREEDIVLVCQDFESLVRMYQLLISSTYWSQV